MLQKDRIAGRKNLCKRGCISRCPKSRSTIPRRYASTVELGPVRISPGKELQGQLKFSRVVTSQLLNARKCCTTSKLLEPRNLTYEAWHSSCELRAAHRGTLSDFASFSVYPKEIRWPMKNRAVITNVTGKAGGHWGATSGMINLRGLSNITHHSRLCSILLVTSLSSSNSLTPRACSDPNSSFASSLDLPHWEPGIYLVGRTINSFASAFDNSHLLMILSFISGLCNTIHIHNHV